MLPPTHPRRPRPAGRLTYAATIDLTALNPFDAPIEAGALAKDYLVGRTVTVRVGGKRPTDVDPRIPRLLAEAVDYGVDICLDGAPWRLYLWGEAIAGARSAGSTMPRSRPHLRVVR